MKSYRLSFTMTGEGEEFDKAIAEVRRNLAKEELVPAIEGVVIVTDFEELK